MSFERDRCQTGSGSVMEIIERSSLSAGQSIRRIGRIIVVQKCANPSCSVTFRRLGDGRLFVVEAAGEGHPRQPKYFWLCNSCSRIMTVVKKGNQSSVVPLARTQAA